MVVAFAVPRGVLYGCGDLIFSSHMIFTLVFVRSYQIYGTQRYVLKKLLQYKQRSGQFSSIFSCGCIKILKSS